MSTRFWRWSCLVALAMPTFPGVSPAEAPIAASTKLSIDLSRGVHTLTMVLGSKSAEDVRLELADVPGSAAQVQIVGGK